jgi:hypothetical protein
VAPRRVPRHGGRVGPPAPCPLAYGPHLSPVFYRHAPRCRTQTTTCCRQAPKSPTPTTIPSPNNSPSPQRADDFDPSERSFFGPTIRSPFTRSAAREGCRSALARRVESTTTVASWPVSAGMASSGRGALNRDSIASESRLDAIRKPRGRPARRISRYQFGPVGTAEARQPAHSTVPLRVVCTESVGSACTLHCRCSA